jgi:hypothetical protein
VAFFQYSFGEFCVTHCDRVLRKIDLYLAWHCIRVSCQLERVPALKIINYDSLLKDINCRYLYAVAVGAVVHRTEILHKVLVHFYFDWKMLSFL